MNLAREPQEAAATQVPRYSARLLWGLRAGLLGVLVVAYVLEGWPGPLAVLGSLGAFAMAVDSMSYAEDGVHVDNRDRLTLAVVLFLSVSLVLARYGTTGAWR